MTRYPVVMSNPKATINSNADFQYLRTVGFEVRTYTPAAGSLIPGQPMPSGTCDYCGTGIKYAVVCEDTRNGGRSDIGMDCAEKIGFTPAEIRQLRRSYEASTPEAIARRKAARAAEKAANEKAAAIQIAKDEVRPRIPRNVNKSNALFDLEGNLITTNRISGKFGPAWKIPNGGGFVSAFPKRLTTMSKKGYYEGTVISERIVGRTSTWAPTDDKYEENVVAIIDNGTEATAHLVDTRTDKERCGYHDQSDGDNVVWVDPTPAPYADFLAAYREACDAAWAEFDALEF